MWNVSDLDRVVAKRSDAAVLLEWVRSLGINEQPTLYTLLADWRIHMHMNDLVIISVDDHISGAKAAKDSVDTTPISCGGAKPLADGERPRVVTSGDLMKMLSHHAKVGDPKAP